MKTDHERAQSETRNVVDDMNVPHHMFYSPTSDQYWDQRLKVLCVNLEPYGYEGHRRYEVSRADLIGWMFEAGTGRHKSRTVRNTMAAAAVLIKGFELNIGIQADDFSAAYKNKPWLTNTLEKVCYYNIRPASNSVKNEANRSAKDYTGRMAISIANEIKALDSDVILVSGAKATDVLLNFMQITPGFIINGVAQAGSAVVLSVKHFSRPSYKQLESVLNSGLSKISPIKKTALRASNADSLS